MKIEKFNEHNIKSNKIPTSEEFIQEYLGASDEFMESMREQMNKCSGFNWDNIPDFMIEFAKLHVKEALKEALESIPCLGSSSDIASYEEVENAVLNAYPLNLIK